MPKALQVSDVPSSVRLLSRHRWLPIYGLVLLFANVFTACADHFSNALTNVKAVASNTFLLENPQKRILIYYVCLLHFLTIFPPIPLENCSWCEKLSDQSLMVGPLSYLSFKPVLHDWYNQAHGMCYPVLG